MVTLRVYFFPSDKTKADNTKAQPSLPNSNQLVSPWSALTEHGSFCPVRTVPSPGKHHVGCRALAPSSPRLGFEGWRENCFSIACLYGTGCWRASAAPSAQFHQSSVSLAFKGYESHVILPHNCIMSCNSKTEYCCFVLFEFHAKFAQVGNYSRKSPKNVTWIKIPTCGHSYLL